MKSWLWKIAIVIFIGWALIDYNQTVNEERLKRQLIEQQFKQKEKQCIVDALYHEARGEGEFGMKAVANVIHNRYEHPAFPDTYCGIINQRKQFSYTLENKPQGGMLKALHRDRQAYKTAEQIADEMLEGNFQKFLPSTVLWYHASHVKPYWSKTKKRIAKIKSHIFYENKH